MKKTVKIFLTLLACLMLAAVLPSCGESKIKSVTISGKTYGSVYLYEVDVDTSTDSLSDYRYVLSTNNMENGYVYKKYGRTIFTEPKINLTADDSAQFTVKKKVKEYGISVKENKDTYTITYYTLFIEYYGNNKKELVDNKLEKNTVEVAKDKVTITYK